jgi:hypothetical protein
MKIDFARTLLKGGIFLGAILLLIWVARNKQVAAAPAQDASMPVCEASVPLGWGEYKGGSQQSGLAFEDKNGTLRFVTAIPCNGTPQVALEIRRIQ